MPAETAGVSVFDWALVRGDGCFEAIRAYQGRPFALQAHLDRLARSASALELRLPVRSQLEEWVRLVALDGGDCIVRLIVTRGGVDPLVAAPSRVIVLWEPLPDLPEELRLLPVGAPWHPGGFAWELVGVKGLSYGPNMAAQRTAQRAGYDDALLVSREGFALEGPTFSVAWFVDDSLETPSLELGVLASITRAVALQEADRLGLAVREGRFPLERVLAADEVLALSTIKEVRPVVALGEARFPAGPVTAKLTAAFRSRVAAELG